MIPIFLRSKLQQRDGRVSIVPVCGAFLCLLCALSNYIHHFQSKIIIKPNLSVWLCGQRPSFSEQEEITEYPKLIFPIDPQGSLG